MSAMDDAARRTWARVFLTLGTTMSVGAFIRWGRWSDAGGSGAHPQVLWTLGCLAVGFLVVSLQLQLPVWARRWSEREAAEARQDAGSNHWAGD
jgi:hypothetical protein